MASKIVRITMFKLPSKEDQKKLLGLYKTLSETATKDGKPYILSLAAGPAYDDVRSQGFTLVARSEFKDLEDMKFYDDGCEAHQELKKGVKTLNNEGVMTVYYTPEVVKD
ncbi:related to stress responsive A/B barrel domain protein [Phialocephala subalpina]|uniref:Related to stress responsive A/B barrel domain protein n=1 Tax=Phialocephala subalpina TaxID=576137 RepID=A0A1L7WG45_9HELO|nr:related to stress responsive A/B barrel domain protein [Phialocephala subalpina]